MGFREAMPDTATYSVLLVEDDEATRIRLARVISASAVLRVQASVGNCADARRALASARPDVLLADLGLPDGSGADLIRETASAYPNTAIMVITVFGDEAHVVEAIEAGATGYLLKDTAPVGITRAILDLLAGGSPLSPAVARYLLKKFSQPKPAAAPAAALATGFSEREAVVLQLVARGCSYAEISEKLEISVNTVGFHIRHIYRKLSVNSRGAAVFEATQRGLIEPPMAEPGPRH